MVTVGIRELKNKLSEYLRLVRTGEAVLVTDRGKVVAELRPPGQIAAHEIPPELLELVRNRELKPGLPNDASLYEAGTEPLLRGTSSRELLDGERGDR